MAPPPPPFSEISVDPNKSSPPSLSALGSGKICIATEYGLMEKTYYAVFIVDLASPSIILPSVGGDTGFIPWAPTILLDLDFDSRDANYYTVSLFKSTLYLFEKGLYALYGPRKWKSVFFYDLSPHLDRKEDQQPVVVTKSMLTPAPDMLSPKNCPLAIPTPDRKRILLLSAQFCYNPGHVNTAEIGSVDFELFNPADNKEPWKKLPSLHEFLEKIGAKKGAEFFLDSYGFITDTTFLIQFKFGIFTIDIAEKLVPVWKKICGRGIDVPFNGRVFGIDKYDMQLLLTTSCAYEMSNGCGGDVMFRPISSPFCSSIGEDFEIGDNFWSDLNTIYDKHRRLIGFVILRLVTDKNDYPHMFLDVYDINIHKYRNDKKKILGKDAVHLEPSLIKSLKFVINGEKCFLFRPLCVSPIQQGTK